MASVAYELSYLDRLEAESLHVFREVTAEFENPCLLFSGGKDSIVILRSTVPEQILEASGVPTHDHSMLHPPKLRQLPDIEENRRSAMHLVLHWILLGQKADRVIFL